jgi:hypothetical protein
MTTDLNAIGERLAKKLGHCFHPKDKEVRSYGNWGCDTTCGVCGKDTSDPVYNPADPAEYARICAEFNVWPGNYHPDGMMIEVCNNEDYPFVKDILVEHDNTTTGRLHAAIKVTLLAIEMIIDAREKKE